MSASPDSRRSNFTQTCNLLSKFLKDKRTSSLGMMSTKMESTATTMDLLTNLQKSDDASRQNASALENPCIKQSNLRSPALETPQLTIFCAGKVLVFDAFPPEKATEVMELATKLASHNSGNDKNPPTAPVATQNMINIVKVPQINTAQQPFGSDMRYPRRASLRKFLEKRKERVNARRPYQMSNPQHEGNSSEGDPEDQSFKRVDLNL